MESAVTIGLDLGKSVFQVHGVDAGGVVVVQRRLTRGKLLHFFGNRRLAWWVWRPARPLIIGEESSGSWAIRCD